MSVRRIFVEKKPEFAVKAGELKEELEKYLNMLQQAKTTAHCKLGKEPELVAIIERCPSVPLFLPKGMVLCNTRIASRR